MVRGGGAKLPALYLGGEEEGDEDPVVWSLRARARGRGEGKRV